MSSAPDTARGGCSAANAAQPAKALVKQDPTMPGSWVTKRPNYPLKKNGSVTYFTAGGGGYGPTERPLN